MGRLEPSPRIVAFVPAHDEELFLGGCLRHLSNQGVAAFLLDNDSADRTAAIAREEGVIGVERIPRDRGLFELRRILERVEFLSASLDADWFLLVAPDEIHLPPPGFATLASAIGEADRLGYNAIDYLEFTFVPTREAPDHEHPEFRRTMRWYYPFRPPGHQLTRGWRRAAEIDLASTAGHSPRFPGLRMFPQHFRMRHYQFLSREHAIRKYVQRRFDPVAVAQGWHGWRARIRPEMISLPAERELRVYADDATLDPSAPWSEHALARSVREYETGIRSRV